MSNGFDPSKFIDREFEQELFEDLIQFEGTSRILSIRASGGTGKSHLLEKFQYRCRTVKPRIPVSLIALDQLHDYSPLALIKVIVEQLSRFDINFANFNKFESARVDADFKTIRASAYLQGANFSGASDVRISGVMTNLDYAETVNVAGGTTSLSPEQEKAAQNVVILSFFDDLQRFCGDNRVVIMLDSFDKCESTLKNWIISYFLEKNFFTASCATCLLALVIAGREVPEFHLHWSVDDCESMIHSVGELGKWTRGHVEECLRVHGFNYELEDLDAFYRLIERGIAPSQVVQMIQTLAADRQVK